MEILKPRKVNGIKLNWRFAGKVIYGPAISKRFGLSLGINLYPYEKHCNYNCIYCCAGPNQPKRNHIPNKNEIKRIMKRDLEHFLKNSKLLRQLDSIAFCGNGEPLIHPEFSEICDFFLDEVYNTLLKFNRRLKTGLVTNLSICDKERYRQISKLSDIFVKIDAGDVKLRNNIYRADSCEDNAIKNLVRIGRKCSCNISTAILLSEDSRLNNIEDLMTKFPVTIKKLPYRSIYLHNINPPTPVEGIKRSTLNLMKEIAKNVEAKTEKPVFVLWESVKEVDKKYN